MGSNSKDLGTSKINRNNESHVKSFTRQISELEGILNNCFLKYIY